MACNITSLTTSAMAAMVMCDAGMPAGLSISFIGFVRPRDPRVRAPGMGIAIFTLPVTH